MLVVSLGAAPADAAGALDAMPAIPHADPPPPFGGMEGLRSTLSFVFDRVGDARGVFAA